MTDKISVLIVDDDEPTAKMLERSLTKEGYVCLVAYNAMQALKLCEQRHFDVIVTDVKMPGKDGISLTRDIKMKYASDVIVISGYIEREDFSFVIGSGASDFIEKPVNLQELKIRIEQVVRERKTLWKMKQAQQELRNLSAYIQNIRENEKVRFARALHDEFGQALVLLTIEINGLKEKLQHVTKPVQETIESLLDVIDGLAKKTNDMISELRLPLLDDLGLISAIKWEANRFKDKTGIKCEFYTNIIESEGKKIDDTISTALYRIVQESLLNVFRHANATAVRINLDERDGILSLAVEDNGKGMEHKNVSDSRSFGIIGMRERTYNLGGTFEIESTSDRGTTVKVAF